MKAPREPLTTDIIGVVVGLGGIAVAILRLSNDITYLPSDPRSQPWFDPLVSGAIGLVSILALIVASIRLIQGLRDRRK
jgi:hypothetical protein